MKNNPRKPTKTKREKGELLFARLFGKFKIASPAAQEKVLKEISKVIENETDGRLKGLFTEIRNHCETLQKEVSR